MAKTCIVEGGRAGSEEHIFPACLGGLRVNTRIYCGVHNRAYSGLAGQLAFQLAFYNAGLGIKNTRKKKIKTVELIDPNTGAKYAYDGENLKPLGSRIISQNGDQVTVAVPNDPGAIKRFIEEQEAKGVKVQVTSAGQLQTYHPGTLGLQQSFGGPEGLRAIGYVAQTFLAHCFSDLAHAPGMKPFIDYTLHGNGGPLVWWDFEAPTDLPPNAFEFGHRVIVGVDAERGVVYGRMSLFSTLDFAMVFYDLPASVASASVINDIDPLASDMPDDLKQFRKDSAISSVVRPENPTASLASAIGDGRAQKRHSDLMSRSVDYRRRNDAAAFLERIQAATDLSAKQRVVHEYWEGASQRILHLLDGTLADIKSQNQPHDPGWVRLVRCLEHATKRDERAPSGLTPGAEAAIKIASAALGYTMGEAIKANTLDQDKTEMFIEGGLGMHAASNAVFDAGHLP